MVGRGAPALTGVFIAAPHGSGDVLHAGFLLSMYCMYTCTYSMLPTCAQIWDGKKKLARQDTNSFQGRRLVPRRGHSACIPALPASFSPPWKGWHLGSYGVATVGNSTRNVDLQRIWAVSKRMFSFRCRLPEYWTPILD
jgi:hypothetical protein